MKEERKNKRIVSAPEGSKMKKERKKKKGDRRIVYASMHTKQLLSLAPFIIFSCFFVFFFCMLSFVLRPLKKKKKKEFEYSFETIFFSFSVLLFFFSTLHNSFRRKPTHLICHSFFF